MMRKFLERVGNNLAEEMREMASLVRSRRQQFERRRTDVKSNALRFEAYDTAKLFCEAIETVGIRVSILEQMQETLENYENRETELLQQLIEETKKFMEIKAVASCFEDLFVQRDDYQVLNDISEENPDHLERLSPPRLPIDQLSEHTRAILLREEHKPAPDESVRLEPPRFPVEKLSEMTRALFTGVNQARETEELRMEPPRLPIEQLSEMTRALFINVNKAKQADGEIPVEPPRFPVEQLSETTRALFNNGHDEITEEAKQRINPPRFPVEQLPEMSRALFVGERATSGQQPCLTAEAIPSNETCSVTMNTYSTPDPFCTVNGLSVNRCSSAQDDDSSNSQKFVCSKGSLNGSIIIVPESKAPETDYRHIPKMDLSECSPSFVSFLGSDRKLVASAARLSTVCEAAEAQTNPIRNSLAAQKHQSKQPLLSGHADRAAADRGSKLEQRAVFSKKSMNQTQTETPKQNMTCRQSAVRSRRGRPSIYDMPPVFHKSLFLATADISSDNGETAFKRPLNVAVQGYSKEFCHPMTFGSAQHGRRRTIYDRPTAFKNPTARIPTIGFDSAASSTVCFPSGAIGRPERQNQGVYEAIPGPSQRRRRTIYDPPDSSNISSMKWGLRDTPHSSSSETVRRSQLFQPKVPSSQHRLPSVYDQTAVRSPTGLVTGFRKVGFGRRSAATRQGDAAQRTPIQAQRRQSTIFDIYEPPPRRMNALQAAMQDTAASADKRTMDKRQQRRMQWHH